MDNRENKRLRALHIASFNGNIGDIANHLGFRRTLEEDTGLKIDYTNLEIRRFYRSWGGEFDEDFIRYANTFDFVIFGGGGFFELKWDYSKSGTTINMGERELSLFRKPVLFNAIGTSISKGVNKNTIEKFRRFLSYVSEHQNFLVTVRNDGSWELIDELYGREVSRKIFRVPDGGFFYQPCKREFSVIEKGCINIAVNVAADMPEIRYNEKMKDGISETAFVKEFSEVLEKVLSDNDKCRIIFVPHIYKDYEMISRLMHDLPDRFVRTKITCAPYLNGMNTNSQEVFDIYASCDLTVGMRYHANVCNIGMGKPCIGICTYEPHLKLFEDINLSEMCIPANRKGFGPKLYSKIRSVLENPVFYSEQNRKIAKELALDNKSYHNEVKQWLTTIYEGEKDEL